MSYLPHDADSLVFSLLFFPFSTFSTSFLFFSFSFSFLLSLSLLSSSLSFSLSYLLSLFFLIHLFALSLHASSLRHKKITRGPEQCTILPHLPRPAQRSGAPFPRRLPLRPAQRRPLPALRARSGPRRSRSGAGAAPTGTGRWAPGGRAPAAGPPHHPLIGDAGPPSSRAELGLPGAGAAPCAPCSGFARWRWLGADAALRPLFVLP